MIFTLLMRILLKMLGGDDMVALYVALVINGRRSFDQIPDKFKEAVFEDLSALGLDREGNPLPLTPGE